MSAVSGHASGPGVALAAWWGRLRRAGRARELRRLYAGHVAEEAHSLAERVRFHLEHVDEYWSRCLGFLALERPARASFLAHDLFVCVLVGSRAAAADVRAYAAERGVRSLADAWGEYEAALARARRGVPTVERGLEHAAEVFARVRELHAAAESATSGLTSQ